MVFYGKVSQGCQRCRQRKVKCDVRRPGCLNCEKLGTPCPGYRDLSTVLFRDECERVIRNVHKKYDDLQVPYQGWAAPSQSARKPPKVASRDLIIRSHTSPEPVLPEPVLAEAEPTIRLFPGLVPSPVDFAVSFFFKHYSFAALPTNDADGCDAWLFQAYCNSAFDAPLRAAVEAAGLAGLFNITGTQSLSAQSKERYGQALSGIKASLARKRIPSNSAVMTVMLLGLFEYIAFDNNKGLEFWSAHIQGALAMLQMQGPGNFTSTIGRRLLKQASGQMLYVSVQQANSSPAPECLVRLRREFEFALSKEREGMNPKPLTNLCFEFLNLRAAMSDGTMPDISISNFLDELDARVATWADTVPETWSFFKATASEGGPEPLFEGVAHCYQDHWAAQSWNNYRTLRILVNGVRLKFLLSIGDASAISSTLSLIHEMSVDICRSAAQFSSSPRAISLIWPLLVVAQEQANTRQTRLWAVEQMHRINTETGFRQPRMIAEAVTDELRQSGGRDGEIQLLHIYLSN